MYVRAHWLTYFDGGAALRQSRDCSTFKSGLLDVSLGAVVFDVLA